MFQILNDAISVVQKFFRCSKRKSLSKDNIMLDPEIQWDQPGNNRTVVYEESRITKHKKGPSMSFIRH